MPESRLQLRIEGKGVAPHTVALRDLLDLLDAYEQAIQAAAGSGTASGATFVSLVEIGEGSDVLSIEASPRAMQAAGLIGMAISSRDCTQLPLKAEQSLRQLWKKASDKKWSLGLLNTGHDAFINPDTDIFSVSRFKGITSIAGVLKRIGGDRPTAQILLDDGRKPTVQLATEEMAKELRHKLYEFVALEGEATWTVPGWVVDDLKATRILPVTYAKTDTKEAFRLLADASGSVWDAIDPDSFVRDHRHDVSQ
jgi:hypothetical protein